MFFLSFVYFISPRADLHLAFRLLNIQDDTGCITEIKKKDLVAVDPVVELSML